MINMIAIAFIIVFIIAFIIGRFSKSSDIEDEFLPNTFDKNISERKNEQTSEPNASSSDLSIRYKYNCAKSEIRFLQNEIRLKNEEINRLNRQVFNNYQGLTKYNELLRKPEWKLFRNIILRSRGYVCEECGNNGILNIHHLHYYCYPNGTKYLPWEYGVNDVKVLCEDCHKKAHQNNKIEIIKKHT